MVLYQSIFLNKAFSKVIRLMTEKEYYLWSKTFNNSCIHAGAAFFFTKTCIAVFLF